MLLPEKIIGVLQALVEPISAGELEDLGPPQDQGAGLVADDGVSAVEGSIGGVVELRGSVVTRHEADHELIKQSLSHGSFQ